VNFVGSPPRALPAGLKHSAAGCLGGELAPMLSRPWDRFDPHRGTGGPGGGLTSQLSVRPPSVPVSSQRHRRRILGGGPALEVRA
jgi:hypothetical protein